MLGHDRDHNGGVFRSLAFVDRRSISWHEGVELAKSVSNRSTVKAGGELAVIQIYLLNIANVAVIHFLVVVVLDLHHLVAPSEGPTKPLNFIWSCRIERSLQFDIERPRADPT